MKKTSAYSIGTPGIKWGTEEKAAWLENQKIKRSYQDEILKKLDYLGDNFDLIQYGSLSYSPDRYPLYALSNKSWSNDKPTIFVTGGVHGYETSGIQGAIRFLESEALEYTDHVNIIVVPCVSPWGYETINRWNPNSDDPNRSFYKNSPVEESSALMKYISSLDLKLLMHIDLHETTDTDNSEFRPALAARDGIELEIWNIPDGFYLVGNTENPCDEFQTAIIESVEKVTHIAPTDDTGKIIGKTPTQNGVVNYDAEKIGLCMGFSNAEYATTTEVYPDNPKVNDENCINAQVSAITGGLNYIISKL